MPAMKAGLKRFLGQVLAPGLRLVEPRDLLEALRRRADCGRDESQALFSSILAEVASIEPGGVKSLAGALGDETLVAAVRARSDANDSLFYAHHVFAEVDFLSRKHGCQPRSVLEIGPGVNLGVLFCFVAAGAEHAAGVDIEPLRDPGPAFYRSLRDYLVFVGGFSWWRYFATEGVHPGARFPTCENLAAPEDILARIDYRAPVPVDRLPFADRSVDLVFSIAALEHVPRPAETVAEMSRVLRPGGLAVHEIDVKHHGSADPLAFLSWSEADYLEKARPYGEGRSLEGILAGAWRGEVFCNRLRRSDWQALFEDRGFEVLEVETVLAVDPALVQRERFVEPFRSRPLDDLAVLSFRIVARVPPQ